MAITIDFSEKYKHLICEDIPKYRLKSVEDRGGYLVRESKPRIPEEYRKKFIHTPDSFVCKFCEEY